MSGQIGRGGAIALVGSVSLALGGSLAAAAAGGDKGVPGSAAPPSTSSATYARATASDPFSIPGSQAGQTRSQRVAPPNREDSEPAPADRTDAEPAAKKGGTIYDVVPSVPAGPTVHAKGLTAALQGGVTIKLAKANAEKVPAVGPGETSGTGVVLVLELINGSDKAIDLSSASVTLTYAGENDVAVPGTGGGYAPFSTPVEAGGRAIGTYVFRLPSAHQKKAFAAYVTYVPGEAVALFRGVAK